MIEFIVTSSVLIAVVIALRFLFRGKISRRLQYALWGLVLLRLLMPFSLIGSDFSIMNVLDTKGIAKAASEIQVYSDAIRNTEMTPEEAKAAGSGTLYEIQENNLESGNSQLRSYIFTDSLDTVLGRIFGTIWLFGSIAAGLWFAGINIVFRRRLIKTREAHSTSARALPVYIAKNLISPCLFGIFRPAIYLTRKAAEDEDSTRYVLAHEHCHYRHGDHIWSILRGLCLAVWWWNPLVWVAAILSRTDSELACDESVIRQIGEDSRIGYGRTLVGMIAVKKETAGIMCAATAMSCGKRSIRLRLNMIIKKPKTFIPALVAVVLIVAVSMGCTFTGAQKIADPSADKTGDNSGVSSYAQQLFEGRNPYIGDAPKDGTLLTALGISDNLGSYTLELETQKEPYILRLIFVDEITDAGALNSAMNDNAMLLLALIDNASEIQWQYAYVDKSVSGSGEFTGSLTNENATAALNGKDIKSCGQSAAEVQALLDWMDTDNVAQIEYTLIKLGKNGEILNTNGPLSGDDAQLAGDVVVNYMLKSAAWPGVDIKTMDECYLLRAAYPDGTSSDYYAYIFNGNAVMQYGAEGRYSRIDDGLYEKLVKLINGGTSPAGETDGTGYTITAVDRTKLEACISDAILSTNATHFSNGDFAAEAHTVLGIVEDGNTTTVYTMALYMVFGYAGSGFSETGGSHMPVAITFEKNTAGEYMLKEYWAPQDGSYYGPSIKEKFPADIYEDALDTQKYVLAHTQSCYAQAIEYGNVPVAGHIGKLVTTICSSPATSSNPGDYIDAHPIEYREMIYYGSYTLRYCFSLFEQGSQTGLEGHIMASACRDIIGEKENIDVLANTGQDWYDAFKKSAQLVREEKGGTYIEENMPGAWILLQIIGE